MTARDTANSPDWNAREALAKLAAAVETLQGMFPPGGFCGNRDELEAAINCLNKHHAFAFYHAAVSLQRLDDMAAGVTYATESGSFTATIYEIPALYRIVEPYDVRPRGVGSDGG